ncbi:MAG TPA: hypothetical protein VL856_19550 [Acidimicrobiia bacterium]|nr:hypothetical protein [Acidimicrobiia bacterium]
MRAIVLWGCVACGLVTGCYSPTPQPGAPCNSNGDCPSGLECAPTGTCEKPTGTGDDGGPTTDSCANALCNGDQLIGCSAQPITCPYGCGGADPHCLQLAPSNNLTLAMLQGSTADVTLDKLNFDAGDGSIKMMNNEIRAGGNGVIAGIRFQVTNGVAVWTANSWTLSAGNDWTFTGTRPVTLFANTTIKISNTLDFSATGSAAAFGGAASNPSTASNNCPGTTVACCGRAGRAIDANHAEGGGGGGGGGATMGANGGQSNQGGTFTGIGGACATRPTTIPLVGGNSGGASGSAPGGAGGGAVSFVAMDSVTISAAISVSGGGGSNAGSNGGGGGGGGGAIFIEAPTVTVSGQLTANGGGGGAPGGGTIGADGTTNNATIAQGGTYSGSGGPARGGNGGAGTTTPTVGTSYNFDDAVLMVNYNRGGGGGGGYGKIEVKRKTGGVSGLASPAASITDAVFQ